MFTHLPRDFSIEKLSDFTFGDPEAKEDPLLQNSFCDIKPVHEFLQSSNKAIVLGERGSGKSALFRLISERKLSFRNDGKLKQIYVSIDEDLEYFGLNEFLNRSIKDSSGKATERFRIAWEIFILNRIISDLRTQYKNDSGIKIIEDEFARSIGLETTIKTSILDLLKKTKKTFGVKLEGGHTGLVIPNFYTSVEPSSAVVESNETSLMLDTVSIKKKIREVLKRNKAVMFVLIDKLDEFVVNAEYDLQKVNLQALLETQRNFHAYPEIKIKLFLRTDLFKRLDFESLGYDKVSTKTVELKWSETDIRQFIARRILHNMQNIFGQRKFPFIFDDKKLHIDQAYLKKDSQLEQAYTKNPDGFFYKLKKFLNGWKIKNHLRKKDNYDARQTDLMDELHTALITLFFPRDVKHFNKKKIKVGTDLFSFLSTHLSLGSGNTTPRIVLMYFEKCFEHSREYYRLNPDTNSVKMNNKSEYPLFHRDTMLEAYSELQELIWTTFANLSSRWKAAALTLRAGLPVCSKSSSVSHSDIKRILAGKLLEDEITPFVAFYSHVGLLKCTNPQLADEKRNYDIPILFQKLS